MYFQLTPFQSKTALFYLLFSFVYFNPCPAEPGCTLPLQTVKKPTDLDLHCLPLRM